MAMGSTFSPLWGCGVKDGTESGQSLTLAEIQNSTSWGTEC